MCGKRPNLLFIMADQLRYDALGCAGRFSISTPNLDRLASEGAFFSKAYTPIPVLRSGPAILAVRPQRG